MEALKILLIGAVIGMADVIPGVSGSTMAVVFNIYDRFVNAITINIKKLYKNRRFVVPLILGMAAGVLVFSKLISYLYENFPVQTNFFFTGLIAGSIPLLYSLTVKKEEGIKFSFQKKLSLILCALAGLILLLFVSGLEGNKDAAAGITNELPELTLPIMLLLFFGGVLGAVGMIVPGISGSLLLLILGVYPVIIKAIPSLFVPSECIKACLIIAPCGFGVLAGLLGGAFLIKTLLNLVPNQTYAFISGLLAASIIHLFPGAEGFTGVLMTLSSVLCLAAGFFMAFLSTKLSRKDSESNGNTESETGSLQ